MRLLFLAAFVLISTVLSAQKHPFTSPEGAFTVSFYTKPDFNKVTRKTPEGITVTINMFITAEKDVSTFVMYNEFEVGYNIEDDSAYLDIVSKEMLNRVAALAGNKAERPAIKTISYDGYSARAIDIGSSASVGELKVILRSNRCYFVGAVFPKKQKNDLDKFVKSFKFIPFQQPKWTRHTFENMTIELPSAPVFDEENSNAEGDERLKLYYSMDPGSGDNFSIMVQGYSRYASFESDTAILDLRTSILRSENESQNQERDIIVGGRPARELIVEASESIITRYVTFTYGNVGYLVMTTVHPSHNKLDAIEHVFQSVKFTGNAPGDLLSDKTSMLLNDLTSTDTSFVGLAKQEMPSHTFGEDRRGEIMKLLERKYDDDRDSSDSRKELLLSALEQIADESTVPFIEKIFPSLNKNVAQEFAALEVVSEISTRTAIDARIRLIHKHTPLEDNMYYSVLGVHTVDSADQRYFYDKVIDLLPKKPFKVNLYYFMSQLLNKKQLAQKDILPLKPAIAADFNEQCERYKADTTYSSLDDLLQIIGFLDKPDAKTIAKLKELSLGYNSYIGILASATLMKHKQPVDESLLKKFAADHFDRLTLYDEFEKFGLLGNYPKAYLNQDSLAISQVYSYLMEDFTPEKVEIVYQGLEDHDGKKMKFYVVKILVPEEGSWYRGILGPFDPAQLSSWADMNYVDYEEDPGTDYKQYLLDTIAKLKEELE